MVACGGDGYPFDPGDPSRGPGELLGKRASLTDAFAGGPSDDPTAAERALPDSEGIPVCDDDCRAYCDGLSLPNPVDAAMCRALWGVGLDTQPISWNEACRRLHVDLLGVLPDASEARRCRDGAFGEVVADMLADERFVFINQRRWADHLRYNNTAISIERIHDADHIVGELYAGRLSYDEFAAVISAHPVLTRRYDTPGDRAEALFALFLGRPPYEHERADMARLYIQWTNGYFDHPSLGVRLPDAVVTYPCVNEDGTVSDSSKGRCTSVVWGYREVVLRPDFRAVDGEMWSGLLSAEEWHMLQEPGRVIATQLGFWEYAVDQVLRQYLGYDLAIQIPEVRQALVEYLLAHNGDLRALHYAVATSQIYLQSATGETPTSHRYTYGPLKQIPVEPWIDTIKRTTGFDLGECDHRLPDPGEFLDASPAAAALVEASRWEITERGVRRDYRDLARTLGGCPDNNVGGRFETVSILTTATQEGFVARVCNPSLQRGEGAAIERLLPSDMDPNRAIAPDVAEAILEHQMRSFFARSPRDSEREEARALADQCTPKPCTAETFARPVCYALLSSSEMLFY